jgi:hypothetical protein
MPNLVLEKNGQTFRFGLHDNKNVTHGKYITVPFNGRDYYARYGDTPTPLKVEKGGRTYYIQYEPVDFVTVSEQLNATNNESKTLNVYFSKGNYRVYMRLSNSIEREINVTKDGDMQIQATVTTSPNGYAKRFSLKIGDVFSETIQNAENNAYFTIERIGE